MYANAQKILLKVQELHLFMRTHINGCGNTGFTSNLCIRIYLVPSNKALLKIKAVY
jgi:hypothetical protein